MNARLVVLFLFVAACSAAPSPREQQAAVTAAGGAGGAGGAAVVLTLDRADGEACTADAECASGACAAELGLCRASRDARCDEALGCAAGQVCAPDCPSADCGEPRCRDVERNVFCASDHDCHAGAFCDADHLCKWPRGGRCSAVVAWCADDEVCCHHPKGPRCEPRRECDG
jgi:hypothetical protein